MRKALVFVVVLSLMAGGCAWFTSSEESETVTPAAPAEEAAAPAAEPAPAAPAAKAPAKKAATKVAAKTAARKGAKSEAQIKAELDKMGQKLVNQSKRTLLPNKANKEVKKVGGEYVATYLEVDTNNVSTEMKPGANGQYVGFIRYQERVFECRGATRQAALSAPCTQVRARNLNELIRYDGKEWQD
ncbi:MAG: translation initiation factor 2 [Desulfovibrio sp.]|uniref:translation initiation factor 2 n=1 Tax=Desulfovibrio sp. TaxID=885 RepID=UPI001A6AC11F|nr:translation initiation factor 2 [Desulfovibrio sp.]MBD5416614.1 translation initiation factor 2 [Desulfovibrio sp.]